MEEIKILEDINIFLQCRARNEGKDGNLRPLIPSPFLPPGPGDALLPGKTRDQSLELRGRRHSDSFFPIPIFFRGSHSIETLRRYSLGLEMTSLRSTLPSGKLSGVGQDGILLYTQWHTHTGC